MDFSGPEPADFANVKALNHAFLVQLREPSLGQPLRRHLPATVQRLIKGLTDLQLERLAAVPFLLLSWRERDEDYWRVLGSDDSNFDLFGGGEPSSESGVLCAAGLAFLWALARRNPYAARLMSSATLGWCERLLDSTLLGLLQKTAGRHDVLRPRLADNEEFWNKLLGPGLSSEREVRRAAHLAALQATLTEDPAANYRAIKAAACSTLVPTHSVADKHHGR